MLLVTKISIVPMDSIAREELLAHWRFEMVQQLKGDTVSALAGKPLTADERRPTDPQPFLLTIPVKAIFYR